MRRKILNTVIVIWPGILFGLSVAALSHYFRHFFWASLFYWIATLILLALGNVVYLGMSFYRKVGFLDSLVVAIKFSAIFIILGAIVAVTASRLCLHRDIKVVIFWADLYVHQIQASSHVTESVIQETFSKAGARPWLLKEKDDFWQVEPDGTFYLPIWFDGGEAYTRYSSATRRWEDCVESYCEEFRITNE